MGFIVRKFTGGVGLMLVSTLFFSIKPILVRLALDHGVEPEALMVLRLGVAFPLFVVTVWAIGRPGEMKLTAKEFAFTFFVSIAFMGGAMLFSFYSIFYLGASISTLVIFVFPAITVLMAYVINREPVSRMKKISLAVSFAGIVFVILPTYDGGIPGLALGGIGTGIMYAFLCAFCWASTQISFEKMLKTKSPYVISVYTTGFMLVFYTMISGIPSFDMDRETWTIIILLGTVSWYIPFLLVTYALKIVGASNASMIQSIGPGLVVIIAWFALGERLVPAQFIGMALLIGAVYLLKNEKRVVDAQPEEAGVGDRVTIENRTK